VILGRPHRFLQPEELVRAKGKLHVERLRHAPWAIDVVHDGDAWADGCARRPHRLDAVLVQLDVGKAALDHAGADPADGRRMA
jgi:RNA:NAD 2'-phosphotransferase (TPT1/KptA family)